MKLKAKAKVYLSKSNRCDPSLVSMIRTYLITTFDIELIEFTGGVYSHDNLIKCDYLLVLPPSTGSYVIGRGQYSQIEAFSTDKGNDDDILVIRDYNVNNGVIDNVYLSLITDYEVFDPTDYNYYAEIDDDRSLISINSYFVRKDDQSVNVFTSQKYKKNLANELKKEIVPDGYKNHLAAGISLINSNTDKDNTSDFNLLLASTYRK